MFLKQEKSEMDDFERRKKNFVSKGKILQYFREIFIQIVFNGYPCKKKVHKIFLHNFLSQNIISPSPSAAASAIKAIFLRAP